MGKRSTFERVPRDYYRTWDPRALPPLLSHLQPGTRFVEPCAGDGVLVDQLRNAGHYCIRAYDIEPKRDDILAANALYFKPDRESFDCFVTNSPWRRDILHPLIEHLSDQAPTWLLFDADWKHTRQAIPFKPRLRRIVSVGRLKWIEGSKWDAKDNCAWYLFDRPGNVPAEFYGRAA